MAITSPFARHTAGWVEDNGSGANWGAWGTVLLDQGKVNYGDGERRFIDDSKWWNVTEASAAKRKSAAAYG